MEQTNQKVWNACFKTWLYILLAMIGVVVVLLVFNFMLLDGNAEFGGFLIIFFPGIIAIAACGLLPYESIKDKENAIFNYTDKLKKTADTLASLTEILDGLVNNSDLMVARKALMDYPDFHSSIPADPDLYIHDAAILADMKKFGIYNGLVKYIESLQKEKENLEKRLKSSTPGPLYFKLAKKYHVTNFITEKK